MSFLDRKKLVDATYPIKETVILHAEVSNVEKPDHENRLFPYDERFLAGYPVFPEGPGLKNTLDTETERKMRINTYADGTPIGGFVGNVSLQRTKETEIEQRKIADPVAPLRAEQVFQSYVNSLFGNNRFMLSQKEVINAVQKLQIDANKKSEMIADIKNQLKGATLTKDNVGKLTLNVSVDDDEQKEVAPTADEALEQMFNTSKKEVVINELEFKDEPESIVTTTSLAELDKLYAQPLSEKFNLNTAMKSTQGYFNLYNNNDTLNELIKNKETKLAFDTIDEIYPKGAIKAAEGASKDKKAGIIVLNRNIQKVRTISEVVDLSTRFNVDLPPDFIKKVSDSTNKNDIKKMGTNFIQANASSFT